MDSLIWILLPGFAAVASAVLAWFVMQSRMEVALAAERERLAAQRESFAEKRGELKGEKAAMETAVQSAMRAAEESAKRQALEGFLGDLRVEQRHFTREDRLLMQTRKSLVLQERMYFKNIPLSDWIEHEITLDDGADAGRMIREMTVFDKAVVNIGEAPRPMKALA